MLLEDIENDLGWAAKYRAWDLRKQCTDISILPSQVYVSLGALAMLRALSLGECFSWNIAKNND